MIKDIISKKLLTLRGLLNLTQEQAAERVGVSMRYYQDLEAGKKWPSPTTLEKIASAFGLSDAEMFVVNTQEERASATIDSLAKIIKEQEKKLSEISKKKTALLQQKVSDLLMENANLKMDVRALKKKIDEPKIRLAVDLAEILSEQQLKIFSVASPEVLGAALQLIEEYEKLKGRNVRPRKSK